MKRLFLACCILLFCLSGQANAAAYRAASGTPWPPFEFGDSSNKLTGYTIDYLDAVAVAAGFTVTYTHVAWDGIFIRLRTGEYDIIATPVSLTPERRLSMDFSQPYLQSTQVLVLAADNKAQSLASMPKRIFAARTGSSGQKAANMHQGVSLKLVDDIADGMEDLINKDVTGVVCDKHVAEFHLKLPRYAGKAHIAPFPITSQVESYAFVVRKGNKGLLQRINKGIDIVKQNSTDVELFRKWLQ
jgi:ABC-type amino acid transport/signal transduction systems, periplasmic component/domain